MRKNFLKIALAIVVVATGSYGSYKAYSMYIAKNVEDSLLMENVEALSQSGEGSTNNGCSTKSTFFDNTIRCPQKRGHRVGAIGTEYSCRSNGNQKTCKEGREATITSCTPYHGWTENVNDAIDKKC